MADEIIIKMFKEEKPKSVFEIGCANGGLLAQLVEHFPDLVVGGMDIMKSDLAIAKKKFPTYSDNFLFHNVLEPWPIADKSYDIVFSVGVLMYIFEAVPVIQEMFRVGKKVIIAEYHHQELDIFGHMTRGYWDKGRVHTGIIRNYIEIFQSLGIPMSIRVEETGLGKTILKCTPNETLTNGK